MSINEFISQFSGGARPNRFQIIITYPLLVGSPDVDDKIVCQAASLPASTLGVVQLAYMGRQIPVVGDRTFSPWQVTILNDISFSHRNTFERWSNLMMSHQTNVQGTASYKDFTTAITVQQLDRDDNVIKTIILNNAWPSDITAIELGYDQNDVAETFELTWQYSDWESPDSPTF